MPTYPTLNQKPQYPLDEDREDSAIKSDFEGGYQHTRPRYTRVRRIFDIKYINLSDADKTTLETFINTVKGSANSFTWTHPKTSTTYTVRFDKPPKFTYVHYGLWNVEFKLNEV